MTPPPLLLAPASGTLLADLVEADRAAWVDGGVASLRRRTEALRAALRGGCRIEDVAAALHVSPEDLTAWVPRS